MTRSRLTSVEEYFLHLLNNTVFRAG